MVIAVSVNHLAVLFAAIASMIIGMIWYSPALFARPWMRYQGIDPMKMKSKKKQGMIKMMILGLIATLLTAFVLSQVLTYSGAATMAEALLGGFWMWIGFGIPLTVGSVLYEQKKWGYFFINAGYQLVSFLVMSTILVGWR